MTLIITGCAGFIGYHLAQKLLSQGIPIWGVDSLSDYYDVSLKQARLKQLKQNPNFRFFHQDIADHDTLKDTFLESKAETVIHLAAQAGVRYSLTDPFSYAHSNLMGFMSLIEACRALKPKHVIYASSSSVYGHETQTPFHEDLRTDYPVSLYAATKKSNEVMAQSYAHLYDLPLTGLRFFTVYGPYGRPDMAYFKFTKAILEGSPIQIYNHGDMRRDFTYIDDIVSGVDSLIKHPPKSHKIYNIGNNTPEKLMDMVQILEDLLGQKAQKEFLPMQPGDVYQTYANIDQIQALTGFAPKTSIENGLRKFVDWYQSYYKL